MPKVVGHLGNRMRQTPLARDGRVKQGTRTTASLTTKCPKDTCITVNTENKTIKLTSFSSKKRTTWSMSCRCGYRVIDICDYGGDLSQRLLDKLEALHTPVPLPDATA